jgi:hypothetical protein
MSTQHQPSELKFVVYVVMLIFAVLIADQAIGPKDDPPNNEPYTGLCVEPKTQGGC